MVELSKVADEVRKYVPLYNESTRKWNILSTIGDVGLVNFHEYSSRLTVDCVCNLFNLKLVLDRLIDYTYDNEDGVSPGYEFYDGIAHICSVIEDKFEGMENETEIIRSLRFNSQ